MATNNNQNGWLSGLGIGFGGTLSAVLEQQGPEGSQFDQMDRGNAASNTLKVCKMLVHDVGAPLQFCFYVAQSEDGTYEKRLTQTRYLFRRRNTGS